MVDVVRQREWRSFRSRNRAIVEEILGGVLA